MLANPLHSPRKERGGLLPAVTRVYARARRGSCGDALNAARPGIDFLSYLKWWFIRESIPIVICPAQIYSLELGSSATASFHYFTTKQSTRFDMVSFLFP